MANSPLLGLSPNHKMSESDIHDYKFPHHLARALGYFELRIDAIEEEKCHCPKECCIKVLVLWMNREGDEATAARLADALRRVGLKNLADILIYPIDPSQINVFEMEIREMKSQLVSLEAKGSIMSARIKKLEEEDCIMSARIEELEEENQQLRATVEFKNRGERRSKSAIIAVSQLITRIKGSEDELSIAKQKGHDEINEQQEGDPSTDSVQLA
ncbi:unnamed protein product [Porites lobata]|uniref:Death domain-containing protein n=1 Tax=Porites lobata TaxID=104759 RepID=A0ABN8P4Z3_9CNID|nr:unnamed protein product [Porites lobata]